MRIPALTFPRFTSKEPILLPRMGFSRFFLHFMLAPETHSPPLDHEALMVPQMVFEGLKIPESALFNDQANNFAVSAYENDNGETIIHGEILTQRPNGDGYTEYVYVTMYGRTGNQVISYFNFVGGTIPSMDIQDEPQVYPTAIAYLSEIKDGDVCVMKQANCHSREQVMGAFAMANGFMKLILANAEITPDMLKMVAGSLNGKTDDQLDAHYTHISTTRNVRAMQDEIAAAVDTLEQMQCLQQRAPQ